MNSNGEITLDPAYSSPQFDTLSRQWFVACLSKELKQSPLSRTILGQPVVLFRESGQVVALSDRCSHRNAPLSAGKLIRSCIQCPYHGWQFDATGHCSLRPGVREAVPRDFSIPAYRTRERSGLVWVNLQADSNSQPPERPWDSDSRMQFFTWVDQVDAAFADALENLLDGTHTPFVHRGLLRHADKPQSFSAVVRLRNGIAEAEYQNEQRQSGWVSRIFERDRARSFGRFIPPCVAELEYTSPHGTEFVINSYMTPVSAGKLLVYSRIFIRRTWVPLWLKRAVVSPFFRRVLNQDQQMLSLQQANIRRYGGTSYHSWEGDLLRGWIDLWMRTGELPVETSEQRVEFLL